MQLSFTTSCLYPYNDQTITYNNIPHPLYAPIQISPQHQHHLLSADTSNKSLSPSLHISIHTYSCLFTLAPFTFPLSHHLQQRALKAFTSPAASLSPSTSLFNSLALRECIIAPAAAAVVLVRAHDYSHPHKAYSPARRFIGQPDYIIGKTEQRITAALNHGSVGRQFCVPLSPKRMVRYLHPFVWQIGDPY